MISTKITALRRKTDLSIRDFAGKLGVSEREAEAWEYGAKAPDDEVLDKLAEFFGVSKCYLTTDSAPTDYKILPEYPYIHDWESFSKSLWVELRQAEEEGIYIEKLRELIEATIKLPASKEKEDIAASIFELEQKLPIRPDYKYVEPSELYAIKNCRDGYAAEMQRTDDDVLYEKLHGAWLGRICGCMLGKTLEGVKSNELIPLLKRTGNYPMHRYIRYSDFTEDMFKDYSYPFRYVPYADTIQNGMPADDDTNYTVMGCEIINRFGRDFTPGQVMDCWISLQSKNAYCTAEKMAFANAMKGYRPPETATYMNPYREWIGAQIRADYFGYINPCDPETAADMAWRDASISHIKNGIYGEMFVAAMLACAAGKREVNDAAIEDVIRGGLGQIPKESRLYEKIVETIDNFKSGMTYEQYSEKLHKDYNEYDGHDWCHTISNAVIVVGSLLYGHGDYGDTICKAVEQCFDTDCNGATCGSIIGMLGGRNCISDEWTSCINDRLNTSIFGVGNVSISEMAKKTIKHLPNNN